MKTASGSVSEKKAVEWQYVDVLYEQGALTVVSLL